MNYVFMYTFFGCIGGMLFAVAQTIQQGGVINQFILCVGLGALGGLLPGSFRQATGRHVPILQSWFMLWLLIFAVPAIAFKSLETGAFVYGFISHLLLEGYRHNLAKI